MKVIDLELTQDVKGVIYAVWTEISEKEIKESVKGGEIKDI